MSENGKIISGRNPGLWLLILGAAVGLILLIFGTVGESETGEETAQATLPPDPAVYAEGVEEQVRTLCSRVKGAGAVSVAVTLKGGYRSVYATDSQSSTGGYKNSTVLIGSGSSEGAVLICYENPEIAGIGIVCTGGGDPAVKETIVSLVSATLNLGSNKIYVAPAAVS